MHLENWPSRFVGLPKKWCRALRPVAGSGTRAVLILDSLERLRVTGADAEVCYDAIARTFVTNGEHLKLEHIDVVYSVPPYLPFLSPRIGFSFRCGSVYLAPCEGV